MYNEIDMRSTRSLSITLPPRMLREAERAAREEKRSKSELVRQALRRYLDDREWHALRAYGSARVLELGLKETDVERLIHEYRREQRQKRPSARARG